MLTDPIADMLTRIRNANKAMQDTAEMPTSRLKEEIARLLKEEGYIKDFRVVEVEGQPYSTLVVELKYGRNRERVITGLKRVSKPGRRVYARKDRLPRVLGGMGTAILSTSTGLDHEPPGRRARHRRRSDRLRLVTSMSRIGRQPIEVPSSVNIAISPWARSGQRAARRARAGRPARMKIEQNEGELVVTRPTERGEDRALHGLTRTLVANMVEGVTKGFEKHLEIQGVGYRASLRGTDLELNVGYSHSVVVKPRPGITFEVPVADAGDRQGHRQAAGRPDRRRGRARCARPSRTRARASATRARSSGERSGSAHEHAHDPPGARAPPSPRFAARSPARPSGRASPSSARTRASSRS